MKKFFIIFLVTIFMAYVVFLYKFGRNIAIYSIIDIYFPLSINIEYNDTHGGFHGDGETLAKAYFPENEAEKFVSKIQRIYFYERDT